MSDNMATSVTEVEAQAVGDASSSVQSKETTGAEEQKSSGESQAAASISPAIEVEERKCDEVAARADKPGELSDKNFATPNIQLYSEEAKERDNVLSNVEYCLLLKLSESFEEGYSGAITVKFDLIENNHPLFLDFQGKLIRNVRINGASAGDSVTFDRHRIVLPQSQLSLTGNEVTFDFENSYVLNSAGLHYFKDPTDGKVYIYSHLEPFFCHRFFPCFDQPSVRAPLKLTVISPQASWALIANGVEQATKVPISDEVAKSVLEAFAGSSIIESESAGSVVWDFAACPPISSYIYGLCAGEYHQIDYKDAQGGEPLVPMRMFCRTSKLANLDAVEQFRIVTECIRFYEDLFQTKFPYAKYDQVYVPEFRIRGMENVGVICLTDRMLVDLATCTSDQMLLHRRVTVHELAHMWFGDLVTMKWWNDLWLKESFADFCASAALSECAALASTYPTDKVHVPIMFTERALEADLKPTTHPIQAPIRHTGDGENAFDMISYAKGACWVKVMDNYLGRDTLKGGLQRYFAKYSHKNTELNDFVGCMTEALKEVKGEAEATRLNLIGWTDSWLKSQGPSTLIVEQGQARNKLNIRQGFANKYVSEVYREQRVDILLYVNGEPQQKLLLENVLIAAAELTEDILAQQDESVRARFEELFTSNNNPIIAMANANLKGYCRVLLDQPSLDFFVEYLSEIDAVNRCYLWRILFDHVTLLQLAPVNFIQAVNSHLANESEGQVVPFIMEKVCWIVEHGLVECGNDAQFIEYATKMAVETVTDTLTTKIQNLPAEKQSEKTCLMDYLIRLLPASSNFDVLKKAALGQLETDSGIVGSLNKLQRYACLCKLTAAVSSPEEAAEIALLVENEKKCDFSDVDELECLKIEGAKPLESAKTQLLNKIISGDFPQTKLVAVLSSFYNHANPDQCQRIARLWIENLERVESTQHRDYFLTFFTSLTPRFLRDDNHFACLWNILENNKENDDKALLVKLLKEELAQMQLVKQIEKRQISEVAAGNL